MISANFLKDIEYTDAKPAVKLILETSFTKEIRIALKADQLMKEHKTPYPIVVHLIEGSLVFGVKGEENIIDTGAILTLEGNVPHDLKAITDCIVKLTLSKGDQVTRVEKVANPS